MNKKTTYNRENLTKLVEMIKINRKGITSQDWYRLAGWMLKSWHYTELIQALPLIDLTKLQFSMVDDNVYKYLTYHLGIIITEQRIEKEKEKHAETLRIMSAFLPEFKEKKIEDEWIIKARENWKHKKYLLKHCNNPKTREKLKQEIRQMERVVLSRMENLKKGVKNER